MGGLRWRFWADQLLSKKSLATAGAAAVGLVGWAATHNPAFGWLMLGGGGAWTALMYYLAAIDNTPASPVPDRSAAVKEVERAIRQFPMPRDEDDRARWRARETQLRRIVDLEQLILTDLPSTTSGVSLLSPEQQLEVSEFVDQAVELSRRRGLLIRAIFAIPPRQTASELSDLVARRQAADGRVAQELDELLALKREQAERGRRWQEDLSLTEISLDQIETFLRAIAYDQTVTATNVSERITRLKSRVEARKESVEELERRISQAVG
jgi:hypothetical protein